MFQAQYLFQGQEVYSPWMPRGGDNMRVSADIIKFVASVWRDETLGCGCRRQRRLSRVP